MISSAAASISRTKSLSAGKRPKIVIPILGQTASASGSGYPPRFPDRARRYTAYAPVRRGEERFRWHLLWARHYHLTVEFPRQAHG